MIYMVKDHVVYDFNSVKFVEDCLIAHDLVHLSECSCVCLCLSVCVCVSVCCVYQGVCVPIFQCL